MCSEVDGFTNYPTQQVMLMLENKEDFVAYLSKKIAEFWNSCGSTPEPLSSG